MSQVAENSTGWALQGRRIMLAIADLDVGGAQVCLRRLAHVIADAGAQVHILCLSGTDRVGVGDHDHVTVETPHPTGVGGRLGLASLRSLLALRRSLTTVRPDLLVSFLDPLNSIAVMAAGSRVPVIATQHADPRTLRPASWRLLRRWAFPRTARVTAATPDAIRALGPWSSDLRAVAIPNPIPLPDLPQRKRPPPDAPWLFVGRLAREKGLDVLLDAYVCYLRAGGTRRLRVVGSGPLELTLRAHAAENGIADRVEWAGVLEDMEHEYLQAHATVVPSRSEAYGNVIVESLWCCVPVVAFDCDFGPRHILSGDGVLVPPEDPEALCDALLRVDAVKERERLADAAEEARTRFDPQVVARAWLDLLIDVLENPP